MKTEMKMPQMGESITEATILKWLKSIGDVVEQDETILEISTDKVDSEIPAPASGKLTEILVNEGDTVSVNTTIAVIDSDASATVVESNGSAAQVETIATPAAEPLAQATTASQQDGKFYSPLVKSLAKQHGVSDAELDNISGTGTGGRVTKEDFLNYVNSKQQPAAQAPQTQVTPPAPKAVPPQTSSQAPSTNFTGDGIRVEPFTKMRKLIAEHMVRSKATSPHVYSTAECDVTTIGKWRKMKQNDFLAREGFKLSYTPFFLEATVKALMQFPQVNASVENDNLVIKRDINLGCAVALGTEGLIVPVIKNASQLNIVGVARALLDIGTRAREKRLAPDEIQGGTFTVTNPGIFGNIMGCPIINQPQLAILSIGAIKKRPVVIDDNTIAIRDMVYLTLSYDHRVIDGALGGQFLQYIVNYLENWDLDRELY